MAGYISLNGAPPSVTNPWNISGSVAVGDVVYQVSGADRTVARADADDSAKRPPLGVVTGISGSTALVAGNGDVAAGLSGLTAGTVYWLGTTPGSLVSSKPGSNAFLVGVAISSTELLVGFTAADLTSSGGGGGSGTVTSAGVTSVDGSLAVSGSPITTSGDISVELNTVAITKGGTGQTTKTAAFDALSPMTTKGDLIYYDGTDNVRLQVGTNGQVLRSNSGTGAPEWASAPTGTVTSAGIASADSSVTVSGSPITSSGTMDVTLPTVAVADGGTGLTSATEAGAMLVASGSGAYVSQNVSPFQRNRLINAAMMVDQRNLDRPVNLPTASAYATDRWLLSPGGAYGAYFDGNGDYLTVPYSAPFDLGSGDFTIDAWIYLVGTENPGRVFNAWNSATPGAGSYDLVVGGGNAMSFLASTNGSTQNVNINVGVGTITRNTWYHVAVVRSGNVFTIYVDGVARSSTTQAITIQTPNTVTVGARRSGASYVEFFNGYVSNLRLVKGTALYTTNFTPPQPTLSVVSGTSLLACAASTFVDLSTNNFTITVVGNTSVTTASPFIGKFLAGRNMGWSNYFDGSGDYLSIANNAAFNPGSGDFCVEGWYYISVLNSNTNLWGCSNGGGLVPKWSMYVESSGALRFEFTINGGATLLVSPAGSVSANQWTHIAVVRSGTTVRIYVNGTSVATGTSSLNLTGITGAWNIGYIGEAYGSMLNGYVSNFRYVRGSPVYTSAFTPQTSPLIPVANTSLLTCASEVFNDKSSNDFTLTANGNVAVSSYSPFTNQAPAGFTGSLRWSVTTPASAGAAETALISQRIEGTSVYDLAWGTASARSTTLSFWVRSAVTGTYCASIQNAAQNRSYVAQYTVSAANTWEKKTIQIAGDTSGTWPTSTSEAMRVVFDIGSGTNYNTTAGAWQAGNYTRTTSQTNFVGTALASGAQSSDFCVTGVQFEPGSVATPFEVRPMQAEVALCQRYYTRMRSLSGNYVGFGAGAANSTTQADLYVTSFGPMRSAPVLGQSGTGVYQTAGPYSGSLALTNYSSTTNARTAFNASSLTSGLTVIWVGNNNPNAYVELDSEL